MAENISKRSIVYEILTDFSKGKASLKDTEDALDNLGKKASNLPGIFKTAGAVIAGAFATEKIVQFAQEAFELGLKAEGVRTAFKKLNDPQLLSELRKATKGTVDDLTLMQATVRADKFKIPLNNLAKYFQFAHTRAKETGQSVDYLVNSIIDGIGRKSPMILDNLGLSASEIGQKFKETGSFAGAVGSIIEKELGSGSGADHALITSSDKVEQLRTTWQNFKVEVGAGLVDAFGGISELSKKDIFDILIKGMTGFATSSDIAEEAINKVNKAFIEANGGGTLMDVMLRKVREGLDQTAQATKNFIDNLKPKQFEGAMLSMGELETIIDDFNKQLQEVEIGSDAFFQLAVNIDKATESLDRAKLALVKYLDEFKHGKPALEEVTKVGTDAIDTFGKVAAANTDQIKQTAETTKFTAETLGEQLAPQELEYNQILEKRIELSSELGQAGIDLLKLQFKSSEAGIALGISEVFLNQGIAIAKAIASAKGLTGIDYAIQVALATTAAISAFAQVGQILNQARSAHEAAKGKLSFAEGTPYLERGHNPKGTDTIPIMANEGERIVPTDENLRHWDIFEAIRQNQLEDYINFNYVSPALATKAIEDSAKDSMLDYSTRFYRQLIATNEGNGINKKALRYLSSIDRKLNSGIPKRYV